MRGSRNSSKKDLSREESVGQRLADDAPETRERGGTGRNDGGIKAAKKEAN